MVRGGIMDNIIKIYLRQTGGIAELYKTIPLYVGMYNTAILDVYVPATLIGEDTSVKVGAILTADDGTKATTDSLPMTYKAQETFRGVNYKVYELNPFPANFLTYAGDQNIIVNVVNLEDEEVESVVTTQIANIDVLDSSLIPDETLSTTAVDIFNARISTNEQNIATNTENISANTTQIGTNTLNIAQNTQEIAAIKSVMSTGENYVGSLTVNTLTNITSELNDLVETIEGRGALNGDVVIVNLVVTGGTDVAYKYFYTNSGWQDYQIPAIESASNTDKGLIQGTFGQLRDTQVDITGGQINNIYVRDTQGNMRNIQEYENTIKTTQDSIIAGTTKVGYAVKADKDSSGNTFETTYLTQNAGVSKQQLKDYALPREFNDIYYLGQNVFQNTKPTATISYEQTIEGIGTYELLRAELQTTASFELSYKNSYQNVFYISSNEDVSCQFRLDTAYGDNITMNTELSNQIVMTANNVYKVQFNDNFNELSSAVSFNDGDPVISQVLSVVSTDSVEKTFTVWSNSTYLSTFNLNTNNYLIRLEQGYLGEIPAITSVGVLDTGTATFGIDRDLMDNTVVKFTLSFGGLDTNTKLKILDERTSEELFLITPYNEGQMGAEVDRPSVADFSQTKVTTDGGVTTITFLALVDKIEGYGTKLIANEDDLSEIKQAIAQIPTKTSDLTNDGDGTSQFITEDFLDDSYITRARIRVLFDEEFNQGGNN